MVTVKKDPNELVVLDKTQRVDYASNEAPTTYFCTNCGIQGVKLWRLPESAQSHNPLLCVNCSCIEQGKDASLLDEKGTLPASNGKRRTDQIGYRIPAVPRRANDSFWGYSFVPDDGIAWWHRLPLKKTEKALA